MLDIFCSILNRITAVYKLYQRNVLLINNRMALDRIASIERAIGLVRTPLLNTEFQGLVFNLQPSAVNMLLFSAIGLAAISVVFIPYLNSFATAIRLNYANVFGWCFQTIWIVLFYSVFFAKTKAYRAYTSGALLVGNVAFCIALAWYAGTFDYKWICGNLLYATIPTLICFYYFNKLHNYTTISTIPKSFFWGLVNIYAPHTVEYFVENYFVIANLQVGQLADVIYAQKITEIIATPLVHPLLRNAVFANNSNVSSHCLRMHNYLIFPIVLVLINIPVMSNWGIAFNSKGLNHITVLHTCITSLTGMYFSALVRLINLHLIAMQSNTSQFIASNIYLTTRIICTIALSKYVPAYLLLTLNSLIARIVELIYLIHRTGVNIPWTKLATSAIAATFAAWLLTFMPGKPIWLMAAVVYYITHLWLWERRVA